MVRRSKNRTTDDIIDDYLSAKNRKDFLGENFVVSEDQLMELRHIVEVFGDHALSRHKEGLSVCTLSSIIPRFLKYNITNFVDRLEKMSLMKSKSCFEYFVLAYGEDEAKRVWDKKADNSALSEEKLGKEKWKKWLDDRSCTLQEKWTKQYGEEYAIEKYNEYRKKLSVSKSLEGYINRYGKVLGKQKYEKRYNTINSKAYRRYSNKVHRLSQKTYEKHIDIINPNRYKRTLCGVENGYQLDHIVSVKECFKKGISEEDASSVNNLRMLEWRDNLARNKKTK